MNELLRNLDSGEREVPVNDANSLRVTTGARLHFGLLDIAPPFGGVGVMIDRPATEIELTPSPVFRCEGDRRGRIAAIAERLAREARQQHSPRCLLKVLRRPEAHHGLGSGTQLSMAVSEALCRWSDEPMETTRLVERVADRGRRSAVGVHGYFQGGLIYETGRAGYSLNPVATRIELPDSWCVALFTPPHAASTISGEAEQEQFRRLTAIDSETRARLQRIIQSELLPAADAGSFQEFAAAVQRYNYESGKLFAPVQGGPYNGPAVHRLVERLVDWGASGVGQSSWGPTVFAWFESTGHALEFSEQWRGEDYGIELAKPLNRGRHLAFDLK